MNIRTTYCKKVAKKYAESKTEKAQYDLISIKISFLGIWQF